MNTFNNLRTIALMGKKSTDEIMSMADIFLMNKRITAEQYQTIFDICYPEQA